MELNNKKIEIQHQYFKDEIEKEKIEMENQHNLLMDKIEKLEKIVLQQKSWW